MPENRSIEFEKYLEIFKDRIRSARYEGAGDDSQSLVSSERAFTAVFLESLEDLGQFPGLTRVYFEKKIGRANAKCNAYGYSETEARVDIVVAIHGNEEDDDSGLNTVRSVSASEITAAVRKGVHVFRSAKDRLHEEMEFSAEASDMFETLHAVKDEVDRLRITVLVDGETGKLPEHDLPADIPETAVEVWDIERLFRADSSGLHYESFTIILKDHDCDPIRCIEGPVTASDHRCYLAIIPGDLLHDLYHKYGSRLLELNVRSFLQARGKVNRGIRDTISNDPGHFFPYNNGISITAEELELEEGADGARFVKGIRGLQVVNGGQTVASIHRAKNRDRADLKNIFVQAKITVVDAEHRDELAPKISRFSNTQNAVTQTDFSANHPFHVQFQKLSESIWIPGQTSRWFYERARGQWEVARNRGGTTKAQMKRFDLKAPRQQKIDKTMLAKVSNAWNQLPDFVSQGGQKNFKKFMDLISEKGNDWVPDDQYYKDMTGKVILFKKAEKIAREIGFSAYRANAVCYTVALLAYRTNERIRFDSIWEHQCVTENLEATLRKWMPEVHEEIVRSAQDPTLHPGGLLNVTEWCKKKECWPHMRNMDLEFAPGFEEELAEGMPLPNVGQHNEYSQGGASPLTDEERERQARIMKYNSQELLAILEWVQKNNTDGAVKQTTISIFGTVLSYAASNWSKIPSPKQTKHTDKVLDYWEASQSPESAM